MEAIMISIQPQWLEKILYDDGCCFECCTFYDLGDCDGGYSELERPPQSWCYVEG